MANNVPASASLRKSYVWSWMNGRAIQVVPLVRTLNKEGKPKSLLINPLEIIRLISNLTWCWAPRSRLQCKGGSGEILLEIITSTSESRADWLQLRSKEVEVCVWRVTQLVQALLILELEQVMISVWVSRHTSHFPG